MDNESGTTIETQLLALLDQHLGCIWAGDAEGYAATTAEDVSFFEWYISPQRIDGLAFHLREIEVHAAVLAGSSAQVKRLVHEILQPRLQLYGNTAILTYTLLLRILGSAHIVHKSHNETRVFHNFGDDHSPEWLLVHCHKSPVATEESLQVLR